MSICLNYFVSRIKAIKYKKDFASYWLTEVLKLFFLPSFYYLIFMSFGIFFKKLARVFLSDINPTIF